MWTCSIAATLLEHRILIIGWSIAEWQEGEKCLTEDENNIDSLQTNARSRHTLSTVWNIQDLTRFPNLLPEEAPAWAAAPDSCCVGLVKFGRPVKRPNIKEAEVLEELTCELQQQPMLFFFFLVNSNLQATERSAAVWRMLRAEGHRNTVLKKVFWVRV